MLARLGFARLIWILLLVVVASLAFGNGRAEAETGLASWYGSGLAGNLTASGQPYDPSDYTAAHKTLPLGTELVVSYRGRSVNVTVNDRGPYSGGRDLDLSQGAARAIGLTRAGVDYVQYNTVGGGGYGRAGNVEARPNRAERDRAPLWDRASYDAGTGYGGDGGKYVVRSGDTLCEVAVYLGVSVNYLVNANDIANPNVLHVGQILYY